VQVRIAGMNQSGGLREINRAYKAYRQGHAAKAAKAIPYSVFLERRFTMAMVRDVAASGRMV
jgi:hypothetical protein